MFKAFRLVLVAVLLGASLPAAASPKSNDSKEVEDQSQFTGIVEEILNELCSFQVEVEIDGWAQYKSQKNDMKLTNWHSHLVFTNLDTGETLNLVDTGPDKVFEKDGRLFLSITGVSPTGSGWIGRVVYDMETWDIVQASGRQLHDGDFFQYVCDALS